MSFSKPVKGSKWKGAYDDGRKFKSEWQKTYPWVKKAVDGSESAYCSLCRTSMQPRLSILKKHEESSKHSMLVATLSRNKKIMIGKEDQEIKKIEIQFAVSMTCHSAILAIDHFGELIVRHGTGSKLAEMKLHRTKCSSLIKDVISPALYEELCKDMAGQKFCIMLDESTDVSCKKFLFLCLVIQYYSKKEEDIATAFLGLKEIVGATGSDLFAAMKDCLEKSGLKLEDCIGYASDGASNMVGQHNSVWSRIIEEAPNCVQMKCICHSLALCIKHAFELMPSHLGFLLKQIPKWFSKSTIRRDAYAKLFEIINDGTYNSTLASPFQKFSQTRWLVRGKIIYNILMNWNELKTYFAMAEQEGEASVRYTARIISDMLKDPINFLYFHFLSPVVSDFEKVNAYFQATSIDAEKLMKELHNFNNSVQNRVYNANGNILPIENVDFGGKFIFEAAKLIQSSGNDPDVIAKVKEATERCHIMLIEAASQAAKRLPRSKEIFQGMSYLHPSRVLNQISRVPLLQLPMQHLITNNLSEIDTQYRNILQINWKDEAVFQGDISKEAIPFWSSILEYRNLMGVQSFKELAEYALACLTTPISNAVVERIFSQVTNVKTKARNRLSTRMLASIIRIRCNLQFGEKCCRDFVVTKRMTELFNSKDMYSSSAEEASDDCFDI